MRIHGIQHFPDNLDLAFSCFAQDIAFLAWSCVLLFHKISRFWRSRWFDVSYLVTTSCKGHWWKDIIIIIIIIIIIHRKFHLFSDYSRNNCCWVVVFNHFANCFAKSYYVLFCEICLCNLFGNRLVNYFVKFASGILQVFDTRKEGQTKHNQDDETKHNQDGLSRFPNRFDFASRLLARTSLQQSLQMSSGTVAGALNCSSGFSSSLILTAFFCQRLLLPSC